MVGDRWGGAQGRTAAWCHQQEVDEMAAEQAGDREEDYESGKDAKEFEVLVRTEDEPALGGQDGVGAEAERDRGGVAAGKLYGRQEHWEARAKPQAANCRYLLKGCEKMPQGMGREQGAASRGPERSPAWGGWRSRGWRGLAERRARWSVG